MSRRILGLNTFLILALPKLGRMKVVSVGLTNLDFERILS